jgi:hypothetical protein
MTAKKHIDTPLALAFDKAIAATDAARKDLANEKALFQREGNDTASEAYRRYLKVRDNFYRLLDAERIIGRQWWLAEAA